MKNLTWYVFYHDVNAQEITKFNVFDHWRFDDDVQKNLKDCKTKKEFATALRGDLFYYFCSKAEYETVLGPWCGNRCTKEIKIDI